MGLRAEMAKEPFNTREALDWIVANPEASHGDLAAVAKWTRAKAQRFKKAAVAEGLLSPTGDTPSEVPLAQAGQQELLPGAVVRDTVSRNGRPPKKATRFVEYRETYPSRIGGQKWGEAEQCYNARLKEGHTHEQIMEGLGRYLLYVEAEEMVGTKYVMMAKTFVGTNRSFLEEWNYTPKRNSNPMSTGRL